MIYGGVEWIMTMTGHIEYQYGWSLAWSIFFDSFMFPMLYLFYRKPLVAYLLSILIALLILWYFDVSVHIPVEKR